MTVISLIAVRCDLCGMHLTGSDASDHMPPQHYADTPPLVTWTGIATFVNVIVAEEAATAAGWERLNPDDDHVISAMRCRGCARRISIMHTWIEANRVIEHV